MKLSPFGNYLVKYKIINVISNCTMCKNRLCTSEHIFCNCSYFQLKQNELENIVKNIPNTKIDSVISAQTSTCLLKYIWLLNIYVIKNKEP